MDDKSNDKHEKNTTYKIWLNCRNCGASSLHHIPKGISVASYAFATQCPTCECTAVLIHMW